MAQTEMDVTFSSIASEPTKRETNQGIPKIEACLQAFGIWGGHVSKYKSSDSRFMIK